MFHSLAYRSFRLFFAGQCVSLCGTWMRITAQSWLVYRLTKDPFMLGLVIFVERLPIFLLGPYAGRMTDRVDHRKMVCFTQACAMVQASVLAGLTLSGRIALWHIFVLVLILGIINAFDFPSRQVLIGELVPEEHRHNAIALNSFVVNATRVLGPGIAGFLIAWKGEGVCFAANAASYLGIILALTLMTEVRRIHRESRCSIWSDIGDGVGYALKTEPIRLLLLLLMIFSLTGLPVYVLLPVFVGDILSRGSEGLGLLQASAGLGATMGALILARRKQAQVRGIGTVIVWSMMVFGAAVAVLSVSTKLWLSCVILWVMGISALRILAGTNTLLQDLASDRYRGRVVSFYGMVFLGLSPFGSFMIGGLASRIGVTWTALAQAAVCVSAGLLYLRRLPAVLLASEGPSAQAPVVPAAHPPTVS